MNHENPQLGIGVKNVEELEISTLRAILSPRYDILELIGAGGMGNVYLAKARFLENAPLVALKVLHQEFCSDQTLLARFIREADLLKRVNHSRIVKVYEANSVKGVTYYSMELITGSSLEDVLKLEQYSEDKIPDLALKILDALNAIHTAGIIHRDLKPANIMLTQEGDIKLTDFGIARPENSQLTHHNEIVGSVCYIAPEIWIGEEPTARVDLYSLGVVLYELATGNVPFDGSSPGDLMRKHLQAIPEDPSKINPRIPYYMGKVILKLLTKQKADRPSSALEVSDMIRANLDKKTEVKSFVAYRQDTSEFLRAVENSTSSLLTVSKEKTVKEEKRIAKKETEKSSNYTPLAEKRDQKYPIPSYVKVCSVIAGTAVAGLFIWLTI